MDHQHIHQQQQAQQHRHQQQQQNFTNGSSGQHEQQKNPHHQNQQIQALTNQQHAGVSTGSAPVSYQNPHQAALNPGAALSGMDPQIMGQLMTNPALAAAAAASPLFPPSAFQTNPGAFLTLSEYYTSPTAIQNEQNVKGSTAFIASTVGINNAPQQITAGHANTKTSRAGGEGLSMGDPAPHPSILPSELVQQQAAFGLPTNLQQTLLPYGTGIIQNGALQLMAVATNSVQAAHHLAANAANVQSMMTVSDANISMNHQASSTFSANGATSSSSSTDPMGSGGKPTSKRKKELTAKERAQQNRDRNREHARSTRLRKKAYIQKLKELVEGLHAERTEEVRQRRVAIQHLAEMQNVRRAVIQSFLRFHAGYEKDERKWSTILEEGFWLKQPVTPYRCFRRSEIEQDCRISREIQGVIADAASVAVMTESVGSRSARWVQLKREDFLLREERRTGRKRMPRDIMQSNRFQHAISSLSSSSNSSGSNNGSSGEEGINMHARATTQHSDGQQKAATNNVSKSRNEGKRGGEFHDYHAQPLPDPKILDPDRNSEGDDESGDDSKRVSENSSGEDSAAAIKEGRPPKRQKASTGAVGSISVIPAPLSTPSVKVQDTTTGMNASLCGGSLPPNISKRGGIAHNVRSVVSAVGAPYNGSATLAFAPAAALPPFARIGKHSLVPASSLAGQSCAGSVSQSNVATSIDGVTIAGATGPLASGANPMQANAEGDRLNAGGKFCPAVISGDVETSSSSSSRKKPQIRAYYHVSEDDMILMDNIIMCPFVFRTQDAVLCGALAECVMPGMLRGHFSPRNKLVSMEMIYDAMGFMQQLERASGSEGTARIIPGSLEMALSPGSDECRVITLAQAPYRIVNVNEAWTILTKYSQMEAEGMELFALLESLGPEDQPASPPYDLSHLIEGRCTCATRFHCDKDGREYVDFISSYPLTNSSDEVTHLLHVCKELAPHDEISEESSDPSSASAVDGTSTNGNRNEVENEKDTVETS